MIKEIKKNKENNTIFMSLRKYFTKKHIILKKKLFNVSFY